MNSSAKKKHLAMRLVLGLILLVAINAFAYKKYRRWDWTEQKIYSVSAKTEQKMKHLSKDVYAVLFLSESEVDYKKIRELLRKYEYLSSRFHVVVADPLRDPARHTLLTQKYQVQTETEGEDTFADIALLLSTESPDGGPTNALPSDAVKEGNPTRWKITRDDLLKGDEDAKETGKLVITEESERAITQGVMELTQGSKLVLCLTQGHGEWSIARELMTLEAMLERENIRIVESAVLSNAASCSAWAVIRPQTQLLPAEVDALKSQVANAGARLFVALEWMPALITKNSVDQGQTDHTMGLRPLLDYVGIEVRQTFIAHEESSHLLPGVSTPLGPFVVLDYLAKEPTLAFAKQRLPTLFNTAMSVQARSELMHNHVRTHALTYPERDLSQLQTPQRSATEAVGSLNLMAGGELDPLNEKEQLKETGKAKKARVLVYGDADWLENSYLENPRSMNRELALSSFGWLLERADIESPFVIPVKTYSVKPVMMTAEDAKNISFRVVAYLPLAVLLFGVFVWLSRRQ